MISEKLVKDVTVELLRKTVTRMTDDVVNELKNAMKNETEDVPRMQLKAILDNLELAEKTTTPLCQDTGVTIFYVNLPRCLNVDVEKGIIEGVRTATKNPGDNVGRKMPYVNFKVWDKDYLEITVMTKGAGSENMSQLAMLTPSQGVKGVKEFILNVVLKAGSNPCPPTILGVGIGGSSDIAAKLAKEALLRPIDKPNEDAEIASMEKELKDALNDLGIGVMGLGGKTTVLGVNIEYAFCHTASLPVAVNVQCWAARRGTAQIFPDGKVKYPTHER
jgi:fumarate hydratase subunit alpha